MRKVLYRRNDSRVQALFPSCHFPYELPALLSVVPGETQGTAVPENDFYFLSLLPVSIFPLYFLLRAPSTVSSLLPF